MNECFQIVINIMFMEFQINKLGLMHFSRCFSTGGYVRAGELPTGTLQLIKNLQNLTFIDV